MNTADRKAPGRRVRYQVAASLDGFIAGPNGEHDWIVSDPEIDFKALFAQFDTALMGRKTFEAMGGKDSAMPGMKTFVFSRTLQPERYKNVKIVPESPEPVVRALREEQGKDVWLFGGGELFASLLAADLVDSVEIAIVPVLLGGGVPLLPPPANTTKLQLTSHKIYPSGIALLEYAVV